MQNQFHHHHQQQQQQGVPNPALLNLLPNTGHQMDLNHLWNQLQELSQLLTTNRESAATLVQKVDEVKARADTDGALNLRLRETDREASVEVDLQSQMRILRRENAALLAENEDLSALASDYESVLEKVLEGLRIFIHEQSISTINIHQSYANQLAKERQVNANLRQEAAEFQARLAKLSRILRAAHENDNSLAPDILIEDLKAENAALRDALGMKPTPEVTRFEH
ncbi:hypothetical protein ABW19_dt0208555 [Dactylella cylindrospora]|nr:hypothetical protein ABW19_dt0208555 [Dactylella cylindrospora]